MKICSVGALSAIPKEGNVDEPLKCPDMKTKNKMWLYLLLSLGLVLILNNCKKTQENTSGSITDKDGNVYTSVTIGTQVWMVQNLKTTKLNDGNPIPDIIDNIAWTSLTTPAYCWYNNDAATYKSVYGALYNWYAVNVGNLCPTGWRVSTDNDCLLLEDYLGGATLAGSKMKETGTVHWTAPNSDATNETGFTALPGGYRTAAGQFDNINDYGFWWTSTINPASNDPWFRRLQYDSGKSYRYYYDENYGMSVRCIKN